MATALYPVLRIIAKVAKLRVLKVFCCLRLCKFNLLQDRHKVRSLAVLRVSNSNMLRHLVLRHPVLQHAGEARARAARGEARALVGLAVGEQPVAHLVEGGGRSRLRVRLGAAVEAGGG